MGRQCGTCCNLLYERSLDGSRADRLAETRGCRILVRKIENLSKSESEGCPWCSMLIRTLRHFDLLSDDHSTSILRLQEGGSSYLLVPSADLTIQIYTPVGQLPAWDGIQQCYESSQHPASKQAFDFVRRCLETCDAHHSSCRISPSKLPTRLIDVGSAQDPEVRLVETSNVPPSHYVALSYCWGLGANVKTLQSNYRSMKQGIQILALPKTLQDAISATRTLEIRYIWIDAICIIQDSKTDWEIESSQMASVYQNAYVTLAAGTAAEASEGFLVDRDLATEDQEPFQMDWLDDQGRNTVVCARVVPDFETHQHSGGDDPLPLSLRGWTLQESKLSTRLLTYSHHELLWNCLTQTACECHFLDEQSAAEDEDEVWHKSIFAVTQPKDAYMLWRESLSDYCERSITNPGDKLPAISGIAKVIQGVTGSPYVAGLWVDNLIRDLLWHPPWNGAVEELVDCALPDYRAPSFSWASLPGSGLTFDNSDRSIMGGKEWISMSTVIGTESVPAGHNPLGQVRSASITLRGQLQGTVLDVVPNSTNNQMVYAARCGFPGAVTHIDMRLEEFAGTAAGGGVERSVRRSPAGSLAGIAGSGSPVFLFYLGYWMDAKNEGRMYLVLGKSPRDFSKYERLGIVLVDVEKSPSVLDPRDGATVATITLV